MKQKILALTVGGSCAPLVAAIQQLEPHFVLFLASKESRETVNGAGTPCKLKDASALPSIVAQTGLREDQYRIVQLTDADDINLCYQQISNELQQLDQQFGDCEHIADYTGGTKTMTATMALAAVQHGWQLTLVKGMRTDLQQVRSGTEALSRINSWELYVNLSLTNVQQLFNQYAYASAAQILRNFLSEGVLSSELQRRLNEWIALCRGFDAWDRFDHDSAYSLLEPFAGKMVQQWIFLKTLAKKQKGNGYEPVIDLMANAQRRYARGRVDDAIARLYRAIEKIAQVRLLQRSPSLDAACLNVELLPEPLQSAYQGKKQLALREAYELLSQLSDPVGKAYESEKSHLLDALKLRNDSILAHGDHPLATEDYGRMCKLIKGLLTAVETEIGISLTPVEFPKVNSIGELC